MGLYNRIQVGERAGKRVIVERVGGSSRYPRWLVRCDCGAETVTSAASFRRNGACKSCNRGGASRKYGDRVIGKSSLYRQWAGMRHRCNPNATDPDNRHWAGRGIRVCAEWDDFAVFEAWALANGHQKGLALDRINVDGNYEPANCQWVTRSVNSKRCRAEYNFVRKKAASSAAFCLYDEPSYADF